MKQKIAIIEPTLCNNSLTSTIVISTRRLEQISIVINRVVLRSFAIIKKFRSTTGRFPFAIVNNDNINILQDNTSSTNLNVNQIANVHRFNMTFRLILIASSD